MSCSHHDNVVTVFHIFNYLNCERLAMHNTKLSEFCDFPEDVFLHWQFTVTLESQQHSAFLQGQ